MNKTAKTILGFAIVGSLVLSLGVGAYAATNGNGNGQRGGLGESTQCVAHSDGTGAGNMMGSKGGRGQGGMMQGGMMQGGMMHGGMMQGGMGGRLDVEALVEEGLIDEATAAELTEYLEEKAASRERMTERSNLFDELVEEGILTQTEADLVHEFLQEARQAEIETRLTAAIASFVEDGTITQEQGDAILVEMKEFQAAHEAERELLADMTEDERDAYFEENERTFPLDNLVEEGIITQEQADAIGCLGGGRQQR